MNSQSKDIKVLRQQKIINEEVQRKLQSENTRLKKYLTDSQTKLIESNKKINAVQERSEDLEFLKLNLSHGHKCRKTMFRSHLFKVNTDEYRNCVVNKGPIKKD